VIAVGLIVDGVPESIALGLTVAEGEVGLALLAGILVGNSVEAYGAAQPVIAGGRSKGFALGLLAAIGVALVVATVSTVRVSCNEAYFRVEMRGSARNL
jgi:ZIP family zinc transporter